MAPNPWLSPAKYHEYFSKLVYYQCNDGRVIIWNLLSQAFQQRAARTSHCIYCSWCR